MSSYLLKTLIATVFLGVGLTSFLSMMAVMGKAERKADPVKLRRLHRAAGFAYLVLLVPLIYFGATFLADLGEGISVRAVIHFVLAALLLALVILKLLVVRVHKQFLKYAPGLGMAIFTLTVVIFLITAGYFFLRGGALE
jgi:cytochrome b561